MIGFCNKFINNETLLFRRIVLFIVKFIFRTVSSSPDVILIFVISLPVQFFNWWPQKLTNGVS